MKTTEVPKTGARRKLPPSGRDFDVQRAIECDGLSTWQTARRLGISQMRVRQIQQRVADWIAEALLPQMEAEAAARLRYAEHLASDRLQHFYCETMEQWRATHQTRFLMQAMRVALAAGKLAAPAGVIEALAADAEEAVGSGQLAVGGEETESPPVEDFSGNGDVAERPAARRVDESGASPEGQRLRELLRGASTDGVAERLDRARSLLSPGNGEAITQLRLSPNKPGASVERLLSPPERPLSRQERRRLQRKLKRAKGLA